MENNFIAGEILNQIPALILICKNIPQFNIADTFGDFESIIEMPKQKLMDSYLNYTDLIHPEDRDLFDTQLETLKQLNSELFSFPVYRIITQSNTTKWIKHIVKPIHDRNGQFLYFFSMITDVSYWLRINQEIEIGNQRWVNALESSGIGVWDWNLKTNEVYFSDIWKTMLGYDPDKIKNHLDEWALRVFSDDYPQIEQDIKNHIEGKTEYYQNIHRVLCKNGEYKWILDRGKIIQRDPEGQPVRMIGTHTDFTQIKQYQAQLEKEKIMLNTFLNTSLDGFFMLNDKSRFVQANKIYSNMIGYSESELLTMSIADVEAIEKPEEISKRIQNIVKNGSDRFRTKHITKDRTIIELEVSTHFLQLDEQPHFMTFVRNITQQLRSEKELRESEEKFRQLAENIEEVFWLRTVNKMVYVSPAFDTVWGIKAQELYDDPNLFIDSIHPEDKKRVLMAFIESDTMPEIPFDEEYRIIRPDGEIRWVWARSFPIRTEMESGENRSTGIAEDITDRKLSERNRIYKEKLLAAIANATNYLLVESDIIGGLSKGFDQLGQVLHLNRIYYFENYYDEKGEGFTSQKLEWNSSQSTPQINNPSLQNLPFREIGFFINKIQFQGIFTAIVNSLPEGNLKDLLQDQDILSILIIPIYVKQEFIGFVGFDDCKKEREWETSEILILQSFATAISGAIEKRMIFKELQENESRYRRLVESQNDMIVRVDNENRFTYVNDTYCLIFGKNARNY